MFFLWLKAILTSIGLNIDQQVQNLWKILNYIKALIFVVSKYPHKQASLKGKNRDMCQMLPTFSKNFQSRVWQYKEIQSGFFTFDLLERTFMEMWLLSIDKKVQSRWLSDKLLYHRLSHGKTAYTFEIPPLIYLSLGLTC